VHPATRKWKARKPVAKSAILERLSEATVIKRACARDVEAFEERRQ
jgi:hypothetical protein